MHRVMLFAGHVESDLVRYQLDRGGEDGMLAVIVPDASTEELESFIRKLYCPIMFGPFGRQNLMVADKMFADGPGAGIHFPDVEDVVRDVGGPANLLNDLTTSDCPGEDIFYTAVPNTHSVSLSSMMQSEELASLPVEMEVSAKYKGAFCEAKVKKIYRNVICKISFKQEGVILTCWTID